MPQYAKTPMFLDDMNRQLEVEKYTVRDFSFLRTKIYYSLYFSSNKHCHDFLSIYLYFVFRIVLSIYKIPPPLHWRILLSLFRHICEWTSQSQKHACINELEQSFCFALSCSILFTSYLHFHSTCIYTYIHNYARKKDRRRVSLLLYLHSTAGYSCCTN